MCVGGGGGGGRGGVKLRHRLTATSGTLIHTHIQNTYKVTLMYCQTALMMSGRVAVCIPRSLASLLVSLYCIGCKGGQT